IAGPNGTARHELDGGRTSKGARALRALQMPAKAAPDARQHRREPLEASGLADFANFLPFGMISVLQPPGRIASHRLEMGCRILRIDHVLIGWRHDQAVEALDRGRIASLPLVLCEIGAATA